MCGDRQSVCRRCHVSNGDHLSRKRRASRGRIAWLFLLPCLPVIPVLDYLTLHQMGPSEQPPGRFLRKDTGKTCLIFMVNLLADTCLANHSKGRTQGVNSELEGQQTHTLFYFYQVAPAFLPHPVTVSYFS